MFLSESLHKISESGFADIRSYHLRLQWQSHLNGKFLAILIVIHVFDDEVSRIRVEFWIHLQGCKVDYDSALVSGMVG